MAVQLPRGVSELPKKIKVSGSDLFILPMAQWCPAESGQHSGVLELAGECVQDEPGPKQTKKGPKKATYW